MNTRVTDGVLVVDKPQGLTSHDLVAVARRCLRERRVGHTGTLDPLATGVLPLACGRATRLVRFFVASDKDYEATIRFGVSTTTHDITGIETASSGRIPTREAVETALEPLRGEYLQVPPAYSAKRVAGERAYARARRDEAVSLAAVPVRVSRLDLLAFEGASARISLTCSAGFYVRSFAHALGEAVGTGACLEALRRTRSGEFRIENAVDVERLQSGDVAGGWVPLDRLLSALPSVRLGDDGCKRVAHGQAVTERHAVWGEEPPWPRAEATAISAAERAAEWVRLLDAQGHLLALGTLEANGSFLHPAVVLI